MTKIPQRCSGNDSPALLARGQQGSGTGKDEVRVEKVEVAMVESAWGRTPELSPI